MPTETRVLLAVWAGLSGLLVGSFLNVCIFRLPRECMSIVRPRSRCPKCRTFIAAWDNIPVVSWLLLGGRCRHCRNPISIRYPLIELLTGAVFAWAAIAQLWGGGDRDAIQRSTAFAVQAYLSGALIVSTFIDLDFTILPDEITLPGILVGLACGAGFPWLLPGLPDPELMAWAPAAIRANAAGFLVALLGALVGGGTIYAIGVFGKLLFRKEAMGFGDVKYMAFLGAFLGPMGVALGLFLAVLSGALFGIGKFVLFRRMGYVPFGPFLSVGAAVMIFAPGPVRTAMQAYLDWVRGSN